VFNQTGKIEAVVDHLIEETRMGVFDQ
jgi:hypothetical protein